MLVRKRKADKSVGGLDFGAVKWAVVCLLG